MLPIVIDRWVVDIGISVGRQGKGEGTGRVERLRRMFYS